MLSLYTNLGKLRKWIQSNCVRGDTIIFGGTEEVKFRNLVTYRDFEDIIIKTVNDNKKELIEEFMKILNHLEEANGEGMFEHKHWEAMLAKNKIEELKKFVEENP